MTNMCLGIPGKIIEIYESSGIGMGKIDFGGVTREVCLAYVPEAQIGDYAMIHVGFALNLMSEAEAKESLDLLRQLAETEAELYPNTEGASPQPPFDGKAE
jgi:hydrogenase expression/formation protein HypC